MKVRVVNELSELSESRIQIADAHQSGSTHAPPISEFPNDELNLIDILTLQTDHLFVMRVCYVATSSPGISCFDCISSTL